MQIFSGIYLHFQVHILVVFKDSPKSKKRLGDLFFNLLAFSLFPPPSQFASLPSYIRLLLCGMQSRKGIWLQECGS